MDYYGLFTYAPNFYYSTTIIPRVCGLYHIQSLSSSSTRQRQQAVGHMRTHVELTWRTMACACWFRKRRTNNTHPPFWLTIKRKAVFVWVSRYEGTPPALAVAWFVQVNLIGLRMGGPRHQTSCVDVLGPLQASYFVCRCFAGPVRDDPRHQTSCVDVLGLRQASYFVC